MGINWLCGYCLKSLAEFVVEFSLVDGSVIDNMASYIPILLDCEERPCLVVGGGMIAERKTRSLLEAKAMITIISPQLTQGLFMLYETNRIQWIPRAFDEGDTVGYWLVHTTTGHEALNLQIAEEAKLNGIPVNVASHGEMGTFINPAVMRRGRLTIAVSTDGAGPTVAKSLCKNLDEAYGDEYECYLDFLHLMRLEIKKRVESPEQRHKLYRSLAQQPILEDIRRGAFREWNNTEIEQWIVNHKEA